MNVVITGASRGIGRTFAFFYAKSGYDLILTCEKNIDELKKIKSDIEKSGRKVFIKKGLLEDNDIITATENNKNPIYILINNAGKCDYNTIDKVSYEKYKEIVYSNLDYTFLTTKLISKYMIKNKDGIIVNISSMWGMLGASIESVYSMTKGGINAFTKALSKEFKESNVDVIAFALGAVDTSMNSGIKDELNIKMFSKDEIVEIMNDIILNKRYNSGDIIELNNGLI